MLLVSRSLRSFWALNTLRARMNEVWRKERIRSMAAMAASVKSNLFQSSCKPTIEEPGRCHEK